MPGELLEDHVVVRPQSEANRLYSKGRYGKPLSGGALRLTLLEAAYLVESERLTLERAGSAVTWHDLIVHAVRQHDDFEVRYLVYRDLRSRGYLVQAAPAGDAKAESHFRVWPRGADDASGAPALWVHARSERAPFVLAELARFAEAAESAQAKPLLALVDEESDLTFYELDRAAPHGQVAPERSTALEATLLADRVLVVDARGLSLLHGREFFGHPVAERLQLSLVEALWLAEQDRLVVWDAASGRPLAPSALRKRAREVEPEIDLRLRVFDDLKRRGLIVKTGFKFGTHFRAYEARPEEAHAPYLIQAVPRAFKSEWAPVSRGIRLSHSVRKRFYLGAVGTNGVEYLAFGRFRP